jgi:hypothetical protein
MEGVPPLKKLLLAFAAIAMLGLPATTLADTITFSAPVTARNNDTNTRNPNNGNYSGGLNQFDLDHHSAYTWRIDNINLPAGQSITGATLTFSSMRNWDGNANTLFVHLFDTAINSGVRTFADASGTPLTNIFDNFSVANPLIAAGTGNTFLGSRSFSNAAPFTWTITFNDAQLRALAAYIGNGHNIALAFDPDCHFWNNGISFNITTGEAVPEPISLILLGSGLGGLYLKRRKQRKAI